MKKYILLFLVILWMGIIFYFSNMVSYKSDEKSDQVIDSTVIKIAKFFKSDITLEEQDIIYRYSIYPVRKYAHVFEYFVLFVLLFLYLDCYKISFKNKLIYALIISILYACSDEVHQLFVEGRDGRVIDVIIDSCGSFIGLVLCYFIKRKKCKNTCLCS